MQRTIYLAGGCFWGVQGFFDLLEGVQKTSVGYANSKVPTPSYEFVCTGASEAAETLEVCYDDEIISTQKLLERFFSIIDPTSLNRQGNDVGTQYRSGIYSKDLDLLEIAKAFVQELQKSFEKPILTEIKPLQNYYLAEDYHQKYLQKNPNGYCHIDISKALEK